MEFEALLKVFFAEYGTKDQMKALGNVDDARLEELFLRRPELVPAYRERHAAVWPEMLRALAETGWLDYRIFVADDGTCIGTNYANDYIYFYG